MSDDRLDTDPGGPGGAPIAIGLLVLILLLLVFLFREELGIGSPTAEITIPERFETEIPQPPVEPEDEMPANEASAAN
ncbi:hypothetical protein [Sphingomicrobium marinum]|uniref:hypothetical protein n=1 Tax=Sphingomicrobium marinum TaxID=1227950 RepID=UPI00223EAED5|nr:hypothetical protein [Sphingomicrobium marinum]